MDTVSRDNIRDICEHLDIEDLKRFMETSQKYKVICYDAVVERLRKMIFDDRYNLTFYFPGKEYDFNRMLSHIDFEGQSKTKSITIGFKFSMIPNEKQYTIDQYIDRSEQPLFDVGNYHGDMLYYSNLVNPSKDLQNRIIRTILESGRTSIYHYREPIISI